MGGDYYGPGGPGYKPSASLTTELLQPAVTSDELTDVQEEEGFGSGKSSLSEEAAEIVSGLVADTQARRILWSDQRRNSGVVLFVGEDGENRFCISELDTGSNELVITRQDDPSGSVGFFIRGPFLDPLLGAIGKQLAEAS